MYPSIFTAALCTDSGFSQMLRHEGACKFCQFSPFALAYFPLPATVKSSILEKMTDCGTALREVAEAIIEENKQLRINVCSSLVQ